MKKIFLLFVSMVTTTIIFAQLSGNYYIPQGSNPQGFASLGDAFTAVNTDGISGTVIFYIDDNLYEDASKVYLNRTDLTEVNNLIIKPSPDKTPDISISNCAGNGYAGMWINATSYVTIDGSNTVGGTTKDLTIGVSDAEGGVYVILLGGNSSNVTIKNCTIKFFIPYLQVAYTSVIEGIEMIGSNLVIENNIIGEEASAPGKGIEIMGKSTTEMVTNVLLKKNIIFGKWNAVRHVYVNNSKIIGNTISFPANNDVLGLDQNGILYDYFKGSNDVEQNKVLGLNTANTDAGITMLTGIRSHYPIDHPTLNIINNFIGNFATTFDYNKVFVYGIYPDGTANGTANYNILHNTIYFPAIDNSAGVVSCVNGSNVDTSPATIKNNIMINKTNRAPSYFLTWGTAAALSNMNSDYNVFYNPGPGSNFAYNGVDMKTIADWQATGQDEHSISKEVNLVSTSDFALAEGSLNDDQLKMPFLDNVTKDIYDTPRNSPLVYAGAYEPMEASNKTLKNNDDIKISFTPSSVHVKFNGNAIIELYTVLGTLIDKSIVTDNYSFNIDKGIYIIRVNGKSIKFVK